MDLGQPKTAAMDWATVLPMSTARPCNLSWSLSSKASKYCRPSRSPTSLGDHDEWALTRFTAPTTGAPTPPSISRPALLASPSSKRRAAFTPAQDHSPSGNRTGVSQVTSSREADRRQQRHGLILVSASSRVDLVLARNQDRSHKRPASSAPAST